MSGIQVCKLTENKILDEFLTRFADMTMAIVAVEILSRFSVQPTEDQGEVKPVFGFVTKPNKEVTPVFGFVTQPNKEIFVNIHTI